MCYYKMYCIIVFTWNINAIGVTVLEKRYLHVNQESSESYLSADRSIKSGLIASAVVSLV